MSYMWCHHKSSRQAASAQNVRACMAAQGWAAHILRHCHKIKTIKMIKILENLLKFTRQCAVSTTSSITTTKPAILTLHTCSMLGDYSCIFYRPSHASFGECGFPYCCILLCLFLLLYCRSGHVKRLITVLQFQRRALRTSCYAELTWKWQGGAFRFHFYCLVLDDFCVTYI